MACAMFDVESLMYLMIYDGARIYIITISTYRASIK